MDSSTDVVLGQLRKLREGVGLTTARLAGCGYVMSAVSTADPELAYQRLANELQKLGDGERQRALKLDFGLDLAELLGRSPTPRERDWLGERRAAYALVVQRDVKTIARWSDRALAELRLQLNTDQFTGDLFVIAAVDGQRIVACSLIQSLEQGEGQPLKRESTDIPNPSGEPSLPLLVYGFPRDWKPRSLTLGVEFVQGNYPAYVRAVVADSFFSLSFAEERHEVGRQGNMAVCKFVRPRTDQLYAITWHP